MKNLEVMQKHLGIARERITELTEFNNNLIDDLVEESNRAYDADERLKRTKKVYRIMVVVLFAISVYLGYNNMRFGADNRKLVKQLEATCDLQFRFDNVLRMLYIQNDRVLELEDANEQLIEHYGPCEVNRAIKATPLPKLVIGV
jgi:hypothetical protein